MTRQPRAPKACFAVKNWQQFQHYGSARTCIWLKLYTRLLDDTDGQDGFLDLPEITQIHLVKIWLLAMRQNNAIPLRLEWIEKEIEAREPIDFERLVSGGWLVVTGISPESLERTVEEYRSRPLPSSKRLARA